MNKRLSFNIIKSKNIDELKKDLNAYKAIKLKFLQNSNQYTKTQKNNFLENFYNAKLNTMLSIINYYIENGGLSDKTNPFILLDNKEEINKYSAKICHVLSNLDIAQVCKTQEITNTYNTLANIIENDRKTSKNFLRNVSFWNNFIHLYEEYMIYNLS